MEAEVYLLSYPNRRFRGRVQGIGWALYQENGATVGVLPASSRRSTGCASRSAFRCASCSRSAMSNIPFRMGQTAVVTVRGRTRLPGRQPTPTTND